jgi:hypothetical protein
MYILKVRPNAESEWTTLDVIVGPVGPAGYTPIKGVDYFDGKDGINGKDGQDGYTPIKGVDYFDGKDGRDGIDGKDGAQGPKGDTGKTGP